MSTKTGITNITGSEASLSLEERFSALGSVVGKLSKCIDDRNAYVRLLDEKLTELKIYAELPKNATYEELSAKIKVSQQDLGQYSQFYSSLVKILDLSEKADFDTVLKLAIESYDAYNKNTAPVTLEQLSTKIDANAKLLKDILELHSASTSNEIKNDDVRVEEKVADYTINLLLKRPNYATVLGSGLLSGLVCVGIGLLMWYKAPDPDEVHVHQRRAAELEIAPTERALEILENDEIGKYVKEVKGYVLNKLSSVSEIAKQVSPSPSPAASEAASVPEKAVVPGAAIVAVGGMSSPTDSSEKDTTPPKVVFKCPDQIAQDEINSKYCTLKISGEIGPVTCNLYCPNESEAVKSRHNINQSTYTLTIPIKETCPSNKKNRILVRAECSDMNKNISTRIGKLVNIIASDTPEEKPSPKSVSTDSDVTTFEGSACGDYRTVPQGVDIAIWKQGYTCRRRVRNETCYNPQNLHQVEKLNYDCGVDKLCCPPRHK